MKSNFTEASSTVLTILFKFIVYLVLHLLAYRFQVRMHCLVSWLILGTLEWGNLIFTSSPESSIAPCSETNDLNLAGK